MKKPTYKGKELLPLSVIDAARDGDSQAVDQVLRYYEGYINKLCTRTLYDPDGQPHVRVDEYMKRRLEIKLIHSIVSISGKARENMETVKRSSNNVIEFLQSEGYIRFKADSEASSKVIYEAYSRWCDDNAQKPMAANRVSSELAQNERLYNVEATNNVHVGGKRVRGFVGIELVGPPPY